MRTGDHNWRRLLWLAPVLFLSACGVGPAPVPAEKVVPGRVLSLPADHAAHAGFANEWWYYAGVVQDGDGREYAFHLSFFKHWATTERRYGIPVRWMGNPSYFAHGALTGLASGRRLRREVVGSSWLRTAGASRDSLCVWTGKWYVYARGDTHVLRADLGEGVVDLEFDPLKPWFMHGAGGGDQISRSHYLSCTRMRVKGTLRWRGEQRELSGTGWADHEMMGDDVARGSDGWDWFALQLEDGEELVCYRFRNSDGRGAPRLMAVRIDRAGRVRSVAGEECQIRELASWTSPGSGVRFPVCWQLRIPAWGIDCRLEPAFVDGELYGRFSRVRYWEGLVRVSGNRGGQRLSGRGYVELTGYGRSLRGGE